MNRLSILFIKKHERPLTKKLYDVTLCNLQGYNKKFLIGQFSSRPKSNSFSSPCNLQLATGIAAATHWSINIALMIFVITFYYVI